MPRTRGSPALSSLHRMSGEYTNAVSICEYFTPLRGLCRPSVNTSGCLPPGPRGAAWALPGGSPRPQLPCLLRPVASSHHIPASHHILILHMGPFPRNLTSAGMELPAHALLQAVSLLSPPPGREGGPARSWLHTPPFVLAPQRPGRAPSRHTSKSFLNRAIRRSFEKKNN